MGVVASDLFFVDPDPAPNQAGAEHGVRLEVRMLHRPPLTGSVYAAQPIVIDRPIWRADLLETVDGAPASHDRTHHHPRFRGWEPGKRTYDKAMTEDPIGWVADQLRDLPALMAGAGLDPEIAGPSDAADMAFAAPQIAASVGDLLSRVRAGELAVPPAGEEAELAGARVGWL